MKIYHKCQITLIDHMGTDISVVNAARVSFDKQSQFLYDDDDPTIEYISDRDRKLLNYLARNNHWTPFAHTSLSFRIKAPIFIARQLGKHQVGLVWNEVSRRYVDLTPEFFFPKEWRERANNLKQGSSDTVITLDGTNYHHPEAITKLLLDCYNGLLEQNVAPEQARMILPQNMMTEWIWTGSLFAFFRIYKLRFDSHAQKETQEFAWQLKERIYPLFPESWEALMNTV